MSALEFKLGFLGPVFIRWSRRLVFTWLFYEAFPTRVQGVFNLFLLWSLEILLLTVLYIAARLKFAGLKVVCPTRIKFGSRQLRAVWLSGLVLLVAIGFLKWLIRDRKVVLRRAKLLLNHFGLQCVVELLVEQSILRASVWLNAEAHLFVYFE